MAASGYTPIILFNSTTASNAPTTSNLAVGELAINIPDGKLYYNKSGTITVLAAVAGTTAITTLGTVTTGNWNASVIGTAYGGTGVANGTNNTITFTGNYTLGLTLTANTAVTAPTSGTLMSSVTALPGAVTGTPSSTTYLRGDGTWATVTAGVSQIIAGTNVTISPSGGTGAVTINASGSTNSYTRTSFTATSGQTTFSVTYTVGYVEVYLNGVFLNGADYTASNGTSVVLAVGAVTGDIVETIAYSTNSVGTISATNITGTVAIANGGTNTTTTPTAGAISYGTGSAYAFTAVGTTGQVLTSQGSGTPIWAAAAATGPTIGLVRAIAINCIFP
jgi:hypothetical protein